MKKLWTLIVVIIMVVGMQLPAEGTAEAIRYTKDIIGKTDSVSLYLQNIAKSHAIESGPLKIQILPMSSETYVFSAYPDMRARRYDYGQMKEQVLSLVRHMDDYWNAERLIDRTFIMIMRYERDDNISGPDSFMIDEEFFDYVFLDNDKGNFIRVYEHSLGEPFILDEHNDVFAVMVSFGRTRLDYELLTFLQEAKRVSISINAFGIEGLSIEFEIPLEKLYYDMPDGPKKFLERIRSDLTVSFHGADLPPLQYQSINTSIPEPEPPVREGYLFGGWHVDKHFFTKWDFSGDKIHNDMTLYAKWIPISYSVNLKLGNNTIQVLSINHGDTIKESQIKTRQGFILEGLFTDSYYLQEWDLSKEKVRRDTTLYTKWREYGGSFRIANGAEPESLDPHQIWEGAEHRIYKALFEGLVIYDPNTATAVPGLAESWTISEDGKQYTFTLRDTVWSDGVKITAQQVVDSWLRGLDPATASPYAWFPAMFLTGAAEFNAGDAGSEAVGIRALDDKTFQMDLIGPMPYVIGALGHYSFAVVPMHTIKKYGRSWTQPRNFVGNGPYVLKEWVPQSYIKVVPNEKYWDREAVKLDEVVFYAIDDNNTAYNMYLNGEVDWLTNVPLDQLEAASLSRDYHRAPQLATYYYVFQTEKSPFDDVNVRKALSMAFDRQALVDQVTRAGQIPAWGIVPEMAGYPGLGEPIFDVEQARKLLAEAGYPNGVGFPKTAVLYNTSEGHKAIAEFLQQEWKNNLNITIELENQEWATYLSSRNEGDFQVARAGWVGDYQDPNTFLDMFITGAGMNGGKYSNEVYDILIKEAAMMGGADRMEVLLVAEDIFINEDQAVMPIYYYTTNNMIDTSKWGGWYPNIMDYHPLKDIYRK